MAQSKDTKVKDTAKLIFSIPTAPDVEVSQSFTANALPARILHDGPIDFSHMHWNPKEAETSASDTTDKGQSASQLAYFRGRKLLGKRVAIPTSHRGLILRATERTHRDLSLREAAMRDLESRRGELDAEAYEEEVEELRAAAARGELEEQLGEMEKIGELQDMIVWGHETVPGAEDGGIARLDEWHTLAAAMHQH